MELWIYFLTWNVTDYILASNGPCKLSEQILKAESQNFLDSVLAKLES